ncbi:unnamed protein product, partial [marine sediment metagenome]
VSKTLKYREVRELFSGLFFSLEKNPKHEARLII